MRDPRDWLVRHAFNLLPLGFVIHLSELLFCCLVRSSSFPFTSHVTSYIHPSPTAEAQLIPSWTRIPHHALPHSFPRGSAAEDGELFPSHFPAPRARQIDTSEGVLPLRDCPLMPA